MPLLLAILLLIGLYFFLRRASVRANPGRRGYCLKIQRLRLGRMWTVTVFIPQREMERLVVRGCDRQTAERLIRRMAAKFPDQTGRWYVDSVLQQLQRDRH